MNRVPRLSFKTNLPLISYLLIYLVYVKSTLVKLYNSFYNENLNKDLWNISK